MGSPRPETLTRHGGNLRILSERSGFDSSDILDFSVNLNPFGPPEWLQKEIIEGIPLLNRYPDPDAFLLQEAAVKRWNNGSSCKMYPDCVVCSNGSDELFRAIARALEIKQVLVPVPSYYSYRNTGLPTKTVELRSGSESCPDPEKLDYTVKACGPDTLLILGRPNNPDGSIIQEQDLIRLAKNNPEAYLLIDEAFRDFMDDASLIQAGLPNILVTRSLTKFWSVPGLRIGLAISPRPLAPRIRAQLADWPLNSFAERVGARALCDKAFIQETRNACMELKNKLERALRRIPGIRVQADSKANFLLLHLPAADEGHLEQALLNKGIAVRPCSNFPGLPDARGAWIRVAVRSEADNQRLLEELDVYHKKGITR